MTNIFKSSLLVLITILTSVSFTFAFKKPKKGILVEKSFADTTKKYWVFFNISRFQSDPNVVHQTSGVYRHCANFVKVKFFEDIGSGRKSESKKIDLENLNPEITVKGAKVIKGNKIDEIYVIPEEGFDKITFTIKIDKFGFYETRKVRIAEVPEPSAIIIAGQDYVYANRMNFIERDPNTLFYFDLNIDNSFKLILPKDAIFIPRNILIIQYRGESEKEIQRLKFEEGKFDLSKFDIKEGDIFEIRLLSYDHVNAFGESFKSQFRENTLNPYTFYFTITPKNK